MAKTITIGIDEVGRGPLAGPVAVGAFAVNNKAVLKRFRGVKDSKQLSENQRNEWMKKIHLYHDHTSAYDVVRSHHSEAVCFPTRAQRQERNTRRARRERAVQIEYVISFSSARTVDRHGIVKAINYAIKRCLAKLEKKGFAPVNSRILLDGSLKAPDKYKNQKTIISGDVKEPIIALASICAKVARDRRMKQIGKDYPAYGFEIHKGYGTRLHYQRLTENGPCIQHRLTFLKL